MQSGDLYPAHFLGLQADLVSVLPEPRPPGLQEVVIGSPPRTPGFGEKAGGHLPAHGQGLKRAGKSRGRESPVLWGPWSTRGQEILLGAASAPPGREGLWGPRGDLGAEGLVVNPRSRWHLGGVGGREWSLGCEAGAESLEVAWTSVLAVSPCAVCPRASSHPTLDLVPKCKRESEDSDWSPVLGDCRGHPGPLVSFSPPLSPTPYLPHCQGCPLESPRVLGDTAGQARAQGSNPGSAIDLLGRVDRWQHSLGPASFCGKTRETG